MIKNNIYIHLWYNVCTHNCLTPYLCYFCKTALKLQIIIILLLVCLFQKPTIVF